MSLPHNQGKQLPPDFPYDGEWIAENFFFLYRPSPQEIVEGTATRFMPNGPKIDGIQCHGFDVNQVAAVLGIEANDVFEANQTGALILSFVGGYMIGAGAATKYIFRIGDKEEALVETAVINFGSA